VPSPRTRSISQFDVIGVHVQFWSCVGVVQLIVAPAHVVVALRTPHLEKMVTSSPQMGPWPYAAQLASITIALALAIIAARVIRRMVCVPSRHGVVETDAPQNGHASEHSLT
jgi:hypothetical protein